MEEVRKSDLFELNHNRKWYQFWKPKYVTKEFEVRVETYMPSQTIPDYWRKKLNQQHAKTLRKWEKEIWKELGEKPANTEIELQIVVRNY